MPAAYRQQSQMVSVTVETTPLGFAMMKTGGGVTSDSTKVRLGGMTPEVTIGGDVTRDDVTLTFGLTDAIRAQYKFLDSLAGNGRVTINTQVNGVGESWTYTGIIQTVTPPEYDANSSDVGTLEMECSMDRALA